jgi:hypothetical protein
LYATVGDGGNSVNENGEGVMEMREVVSKAKSLGIDPGGMTKSELIWAIQRGEGFSPCFESGDKDCPYTDCCFRADCLRDKQS